MHVKKDLSFSALRKKLSACFERLPEHRQSEKIKHSLHDVFMSRKLSGLKEVSRMECRDLKGRLHVYEWINEVPLNGNKETVSTNYFEYWLIDNGKVGYHNSWVTDIPINKQNIRELVRGGRCRWKIENETFNTLKNQGYHIEHNFGHGKKNLSLTGSLPRIVFLCFKSCLSKLLQVAPKSGASHKAAAQITLIAALLPWIIFFTRNLKLMEKNLAQQIQIIFVKKEKK